MKVKINQLNEQINKSNADLIIQQLKKENNQLRQLVNRYHKSNRELHDLKTKEVGINFA